MSMAFEITREDVENVLRPHGITDAAGVDRAERIVQAEDARITNAALDFDSIEAQTSAAYHTMETILMEREVLAGAKHWRSPGGSDEGARSSVSQLAGRRPESLRVTRWLRSGEFDRASIATVRDVLDQ